MPRQEVPRIDWGTTTSSVTWNQPTAYDPTLAAEERVRERPRVMPRNWTANRNYSDRFAWDTINRVYLYRRNTMLYTMTPDQVQDIGRNVVDLMNARTLNPGDILDPLTTGFAQRFRVNAAENVRSFRLLDDHMSGSRWQLVRDACVNGRNWETALMDSDSTRAENMRRIREQLLTRRAPTVFAPTQPDELPPGVEWEPPSPVAQQTAVGRGSCIDRQTSISCPEGCPCGG